MPANLLVNPYAPIRRKPKPSARQRKRNREAKATALPTPVSTTAEPMDICVESAVTDCLSDITDSISNLETSEPILPVEPAESSV